MPTPAPITNKLASKSSGGKTYLFPQNPITKPRIITMIEIKLGTGRPKSFLNISLKKKNEKNPSSKLKIMRIFSGQPSYYEINGCHSIDQFESL